MNEAKRKRLEKKGWQSGSAADFLGLSPEELSYIDLKIALGESLQAKRRKTGMTQTELAQRLHSSQSRVAKMEKADPSVSVDLLVRSLYVLGSGNGEIASVVAEAAPGYRATGSTVRGKRRG